MTLLSKTYGQTIIGSWKTNSEIGVKNYEVQKSTDQLNWQSIATINPNKLPDGNSYSYQLPQINLYYRIQANMDGGTYLSNIIFPKGNTNSAEISNAKIKTFWVWDNLSFDVKNEVNVSYYLIEKSTGGSIKITASGRTSYSTSVIRLGKRPNYKVTVVFLDGTKGQTTNFN